MGVGGVAGCTSTDGTLHPSQGLLCMEGNGPSTSKNTALTSKQANAKFVLEANTSNHGPETQIQVFKVAGRKVIS